MTKTTRRLGLAATAVFLAPLVVGQRKAIGPDDGLPSIDAAIEKCRASGLQGRDLIEYAIQVVHQHFITYSIRAPWMTTDMAWGQRRGCAPQYNGCLNEILTALGFETEMVFAARVRTDKDRAWWWMNHVWVRVWIDGRRRDVCARYSTQIESVDFVILTPPRPWRAQSRITLTAAACVGSAWNQWRTLGDETLPHWIEGPFQRR